MDLGTVEEIVPHQKPTDFAPPTFVPVVAVVVAAAAAASGVVGAAEAVDCAPDFGVRCRFDVGFAPRFGKLGDCAGLDFGFQAAVLFA